MEYIDKILKLLREWDFILRYKSRSLLEKIVLWMLLLISLYCITSIFNTSQVIGLVIQKIGERIIYIFITAICITLMIIILKLRKKHGYEVNVYNYKEIITENPCHKRFRFILENKSSRDILFTGLILEYRYYQGMCCAIEEYKVMDYKEKYMVFFEIDTSDTSKKTVKVELENEVMLRKGISNSRYFDFELNLIYKMINTTYHPQCDWDIVFRVYIVDSQGIKHRIISDSLWRAEGGVVNEYENLILYLDEGNGAINY